MPKSIFVNPRHSYAPDDRNQPGHIYLGSSAEVAIAQYNRAGATIERGDENIRPVNLDKYDVVGVTAVGAPSIPEIRHRFCQTLSGTGQKLIIGGQVVTGLSDREFRRIFGMHPIKADNVAEVAKVLGADPTKLTPDVAQSLQPIYEQISDEDMREYLSREFSFFLSQGCKYNCSFCGIANKNKPERYRHSEVQKTDLEYLVQRAESLGISKLKIYISNLDAFQTPDKLQEFAERIVDIMRNNPGFTFDVRALATVAEYCKVAAERPDVIRSLQVAGFTTFGFGIDGNEIAWANVGKGHNSNEGTKQMLGNCREHGFQPQAIMVSGFLGEFEKGIQRGIDSLRQTVANTRTLKEQYPEVDIRPHCAKLIPGDAYWSGKKRMSEDLQRYVDTAKHYLCSKPDTAALCFDFKAKPSVVSHVNPFIREQVSKQYAVLNEVAEKTSEAINPPNVHGTTEENQAIAKQNVGKYDY